VQTVPNPTQITVVRGQAGTTAFELPNGTAVNLAYDQRGFPRVVNGNEDIGAYQTQAPTPTTVYGEAGWSNLSSGTIIPDADPVAPGDQLATIGYNAFATVNAALSTVAANGTVIVNAGIYNEAVVLSTPVTLNLQQGAISFNSLASSVASDTININGITLTIGGDNTTTSVSSVITGSGGLVKTGTGTIILSAPNTYTGPPPFPAATSPSPAHRALSQDRRLRLRAVPQLEGTARSLGRSK
jgi:hypothetical protein